MDIWKAKQLFEQNEFIQSQELLNELIINNPGDIDSLILRGRISSKMQKWGDAMNDFAAVLDLDPDNSDAKTGLEMARNILSYFTPDMFNP
jgi:cytochrome c-type biogenesis protein CcmH/NrfG